MTEIVHEICGLLCWISLMVTIVVVTRIRLK